MKCDPIGESCVGMVKPGMRFAVCFLGVLLCTHSPTLADTPPERVIEESRALLKEGRIEEVRERIRQLISVNGEETVWAEAIRVQRDAGLLGDAADAAESLTRWTKGTPRNASYQQLLEDVMLKHEAELDRVLAANKWTDLGEGEPEFYQRLSQVLRRMARLQAARSEQVLVKAVALLKQGPGELEHRGSVRWDGPVSRFLAMMGNTPELARAVLKMADTEGLTLRRDWCADYARSMTSKERWSESGHVKALFTATPFVGEVDEYHDLFLPGPASETLVAELVTKLAQDDVSDLKVLWLQEVASRKERAFGMELVACLVKDDGQNTGLKNFLARRKAELAKLSGEKALALATLLATKVEALRSPAPMPAELADLVNPLWDAESAYLNEIQARWRDALSFGDLKLNADAAVAVVTRAFPRLAVRSRTHAIQLLEQTCKLIRDSHVDAEGRLMAGLLQEVALFPETLSVVLLIAEREGVLQQGGWRQQVLGGGWRPEKHTAQPERLITYLEAAGVLGDAMTFTAGWRTNEPFRTEFVTRVTNSLVVQRGVTDDVVKLLGQRTPRTFGTDVLRALLRPGSDVTLVQVAQTYRDELTLLPADRRAEVVRFFAYWVSDLEGLARTLPAFQEALEATLADRRAAAFAKVDLILTAEKPQALPEGALPDATTFARGPRRATSVMIDLAADLATVALVDPPKAESAFKKYTGMIVAASPKDLNPRQQLIFGPVGPWLQCCLKHPGLHVWARDAALKIDPAGNTFWAGRVRDELFPKFEFEDASGAVVLMEKNGLLAAIAKYDPIVWAPGESSLGMALNRIRSEPVTLRKDVAKLLASRTPRTLGTTVMMAACETTGEPANKVLGECLHELQTLPPATLKTVHDALERMFPFDLRHTNTRPPEGAFALLLASSGKPPEKPAKQPSPAAAGLVRPGGGETVAVEYVEKLLAGGEVEKASSLLNLLVPMDGASPIQEEGRVAMFQMNPEGIPRRLQEIVKLPQTVRTSGLILAKLQADRSGRLGVPGPTMAGLIAQNLQSAWYEAGGLVEPAPAAIKVLMEFSTALGEVPPEVQGPVLGEFLKSLPAALRVKVLEWAVLCDTRSPVYVQAREMTQVWELLEACRLDRGLAEQKKWGRLVSFVNSGMQGPRARFGVASYWCREARGQAPLPLVIQGTRLALQFWKAREYVPVRDMADVMNSFSSVADSAEWRRVAEEFEKEWEKITLALKKSNIRLAGGDALQATIAILSRLGRETSLELLFETYSVLTEELWPVGVMAHYGANPLAAVKLRERKSHLSYVSSESEYLPGLPLPSPEMVTAFAREIGEKEADLALLGEEALLSIAKVDEKNGTPEARKAWLARMDQFARKVAAQPVTDSRVRRMLYLRILQSCPEVLETLAGQIETEATAPGAWNEIRFGATPDEGAVDLMAMAAAVKVRAGSPAAISQGLERMVAELRKAGVRDELTVPGVSGAYLLKVMECLAPFWPTMTEEQRGAVMSHLLAEAGSKEVKMSGDYRLGAVRWLLEWWRGDAGKVQGPPLAMPEGRLPDELVARVGRVMRKMTHNGREWLPEATRIRLMATAMNRSEFQSGTTVAGRVSPVLEDLSYILSPAEMIRHGKELAKVSVRGGKTSYDLAIIAIAEGMDEDALEILALAQDESFLNHTGAVVSLKNSGHSAMARKVMAGSLNVGAGWSVEWVDEARVALLLKRDRDTEAVDLIKGLPDSRRAPAKAGLVKIYEMRGRGPSL